MGGQVELGQLLALALSSGSTSLLGLGGGQHSLGLGGHGSLLGLAGLLVSELLLHGLGLGVDVLDAVLLVKRKKVQLVKV